MRLAQDPLLKQRAGLKFCVGVQVLGADKDEWSQTRQQLGASIDVCMGGRVAEELVFGADQVRCPRRLQTWLGGLRIMCVLS